MIPSQSFFFIFSLSLIFNTLASPTLERNALLEFKNEFPMSAPDPEDPFASCFSSWNTSSDHCSWKGVTCDVNSGEVISLFLEDIFLNGSLKANTSLLKLHHLQHLTLINCHLRGEISSSLGNLSHLMQLDLSYNELGGQIPPSMGNLNQLTFLNLGPNNLSGNIPSSFANFNKLSQLSLSYNQFSGGGLPHILSNLTSLSLLDLSNNHFKSKLPSNMSGLNNLEIFSVSGNYFGGNVPTSLFMIPSLKEVYLSENQLEGPLEIGNISSFSDKLQTLDLRNNRFIGEIPESMSKLVSLYSLDLSNNSFIGEIPDSISKLVSLNSIDLSYNKLEGQVPSFLWSLSSLKLSHNSFSSLEDSMQVFVNGRPVHHVDLGSNSLRGSFPIWICNCTSLVFLDLSNNHLSGSIPSCLMDSSASVRQIILRNNKLSGFLPDIFNSATKLRSLDVSRNKLSGKLPRSLINCSSMEYLNMKGNNFKDTFPSWLSSLGSLRVLFLGSNAFYGPISSHFGFSSLRVIDISNNSFNGTLPQDYFVNWLEMSTVWHIIDKGRPSSVYMGELYNYTDSMDMMYKGVDTEFQLIFLAYKAIDFSGNKFTGRIPKSALDLSHNKLSGYIPRDLAKLSFLSYLDFSHNLLQGPVPRSTQFQSQNCSSFEDNLGLYGLEEICGPIHVPHPTSGDSQQSEEFSSEESEEVLNWIVAAIAFGPGVFCGLVTGHFFFTSQKHKWLMENFSRNHPGGIRTVR
ncbi:BnaA06g38460D [Brassica napus]|uniref:BnaA06g38460D protein n=1 Tax=Brassica napus TaxID=3708 RepID=A0A078JWL1_BRANA|nr:BnaA06g38460D [Brassica napus]